PVDRAPHRSLLRRRPGGAPRADRARDLRRAHPRYRRSRASGVLSARRPGRRARRSAALDARPGGPRDGALSRRARPPARRRARRDRAGRPTPLGAGAAPRARVRRAGAARAPARPDAAAPAPGRDPADRQRRPRPRRAHAMILARLALGAAAGWAAYAWGAHLLTPGCVWRGPATRRHLAVTFDDGPDRAWPARTLAGL